MNINTDRLVSITDANKNFSKVARLVDEKGSAVILKNNSAKYVLMKMDEYEKLEMANRNFDTVSDRILNENIEAFKELAK